MDGYLNHTCCARHARRMYVCRMCARDMLLSLYDSLTLYIERENGWRGAVWDALGIAGVPECTGMDDGTIGRSTYVGYWRGACGIGLWTPHLEQVNA